MPASIGVNLRVTGNCRQGGRKYMEDFFSVAYQQTEDEKDLEYAFFGIFDGHGGAEAAAFAKEHLMETIIKHKNFWSDNDEDVLRAIKDGYIATHYAMWREQSKWPKTSSGLPSTAGTTASVAFIRRGKIYIGHVGDSGIILGYQEPGCSEWKAKPLTKDHKPENSDEMKRIESCGGKVVSKSGVPRVVWNRPKIGHQGPVRRSTPIDEIPFLAVARSLGDLWSYNSQINQFIVSPDPDCSVLPIDANIHRCLIFGTDGLFNMLSPSMAVHIVQHAERHNECSALSDSVNKIWLNPSKLLVQRALERWLATKMRADNTSVVTLMLDPPGPPRAQVLKDRKKNLPESGLKIMTRYDESGSQEPLSAQTNCSRSVQNTEIEDVNNIAKVDLNCKPVEPLSLTEFQEKDKMEEQDKINEKSVERNEDHCNYESNSNISISSSDISSNFPLKERNEKHFVPKVRESTSFDPREPESLRDSLGICEAQKENNVEKIEDNTIQINEISSSNIEENTLDEDKSTSVALANEKVAESRVKSVLRSNSKKCSKIQEVESKKILKRKLEADDSVQRKSLRLSLNQKFLSEMKKPAPCTLAEEKLKKMAEEAEKLKKLKEQDEGQIVESNNNSNDSISDNTKLSITQKILKGKRMNFKKKNVIKTRLSKRKLKVVFETVVGRTTRRKQLLQVEEKKFEKIVDGGKKNEDVEKTKRGGNKVDKLSENIQQPKNSISKIKKLETKVVISGKLSKFKRQSLRTASIRSKETNIKKGRPLKNIVENSNKKVADKKLQKSALNVKNVSGTDKVSKGNIPVKEKGKKDVKANPKKHELESSGRRETRNSLNSISSKRSNRNSDVNKGLNTKENITPKGVKVSSSNKKKNESPSLRKNTLRQRIQEKTKTLKKTVLRK